MTTHFNSVDDYLALPPETAQVTLQLVRATIRKALPEAEEVISYNMPAYRVYGRVALYFAGWKRHYSLYPCTEPVITKFKKELEPFEVNDNGTVRFPLSEAVPVKLIADIARFRVSQIFEATSASLKKAKPGSTSAPEKP